MKVGILSEQPLGRRAKSYDERENNPGTTLNLDWLPLQGIICLMASTIAVGKQFIIVPSYALSLQRKYFYQVLATYQRTKRRGRSHLNR